MFPVSRLGRDSVEIDRVAMQCGIAECEPPRFDPETPEHHRSVLIQVRGFSCNYRDKGFAYMMKSFPQTRRLPIGSEFVGEVIAVGKHVVAFQPGDRVIPNHHYTGDLLGDDGYRQGVATNQASREHLVLHAEKLLPAPKEMTNAVASVFTLNAQTAYSMVRRTGASSGDRVLVTSARSNTSLFVIHALKAIGATIYATTSSESSAERVREIEGVERVVAVGRGDGFMQNEELVKTVKQDGMFDVVFDPMFDIHLQRAVQLLGPFGRYVSCGLLGQNPNSKATSGLSRDPDCRAIMEHVLQKNLTIIGNCVGTTDDLVHALADYASGQLGVTLDSTYSDDSVAGFLNRTFNDRERFGKVSFLYN